MLDGAVLVAAGDESVDGGAGSLFHFDPDERHSVTSGTGARLLLLCSVDGRGALPRRPARRVRRQRFLAAPF